jgi:hypothetical protein
MFSPQLTKPIRVLCCLVLAAVGSGCGTVYTSEVERQLESAERMSFTLQSTVDGAYRQVFGRFQECLSVYGYRVHGTISRERDAANVIVDSGIGFDRVFYLADAIFLQAELERLAPDRARVTFVLVAPQARPFADAAKGWLTEGEGPCRA